ncbi:MAG: hypothetical protein PHU64_06165 [Candidatus Omnitrophica bacterium]|nr:hypothetical protein [Candidatus Omnitrophota bacterium]MDD5429509.1 hypothetical protein [Candidatus Omnitrophota bacterium]
MGKRIKCPVCGENFELEPDLDIGDVTDCPGCCGELKILNLDPVEVEESIGFAEDYDDDYEDEEDKEDE